MILQRALLRCVWTYHQLTLSTVDVEDLLEARGVIVRKEVLQLWRAKEPL